MCSRHPFSVIMIVILACLVGCNPQQELWDKYDDNMEIITVQDANNTALTLPAARRCLLTLNQIKRENPNAKHPEGSSVDKLISDLESLVESMESLKKMQDANDAFQRAMNGL